MHINRLIPNLCSTDLAASKAFYLTLFDLKVNFDSDWYVQLADQEKPFELGLIDMNHQIVPEAARQAPQGFYLTFEVPSADAIYEKAQAHNYKILQAPEDTFYGQRRLVLQAPEGTVIDASSLIQDWSPG